MYVYISFLQLLVMVMKYNWETHSNKLLPWFQSFRQSIDAQEPITSPDVRSAGRVSAQLKPSMAGKSWRIHQDFDDFSHSDVIYRGFSMDFPTFIYFYPISSYDLPIKKKKTSLTTRKKPHVIQRQDRWGSSGRRSLPRRWMMLWAYLNLLAALVLYV